MPARHRSEARASEPNPVNPKRRRVALLAFGALATLSGCIVVPAGRHHAPRPGPGPRDDGADGDDVVPVAPPAPQADVVVVAPGPGFFWIGGYWAWRAGRHVWIGGRWETHRPGWRWAPFAWQRHPRGWRAVPGRWERH